MAIIVYIFVLRKEKHNLIIKSCNNNKILIPLNFLFGAKLVSGFFSS